MKKNFKRTISMLITLCMLAAACISVSAASGQIPALGQDYDDVVTLSNSDEIIITGTGTDENYHRLFNDITIGDDGAAISFRLKTDSDTPPSFLSLWIEKTGTDYKNHNQFFVYDNAGTAALSEKDGVLDWANNANNSTMKKSTTKGDWVNLGIKFHKDGTITGYVDGEELGTAPLKDANKLLLTTESSVTLFASTQGANGKSYIDDIIYSKNADRLVAKSSSTTVSADNPISIDFTSNIINKNLVSGVKVYSCVTGAEVAAESGFDGNTLKVNITGDMTGGQEYRIQMPAFKDTFGNTLFNDNVYLTTAIPTEDSEPEESTPVDIYPLNDFSGYTSTEAIAAPTGWVTNKQNGETVISLKPETTDKGTSVLLKKASTANSNWETVGMTLLLDDKYTTGELTFSYDLKPLIVTGTNNGGSYVDPVNLHVMAFDKDPGTAQITNTTAAPKTFAAISEYKLLYLKKKVLKDTDRSESFEQHARLDGSTKVSYLTPDDYITIKNLWSSAGNSSNVQTVQNPEWYSMKSVFNFTEGKVYYYVGEEKVGEANLSDLGIDGIKAFSFALGTNVYHSEQLIDNVKVTYTAPGGITNIYPKNDFSGYTETGDYVAPTGWTKSVGGGSETQMKPASTDNGTSVYLKKATGSQNGWDKGGMYYKFDNKYTTGTLTMSFDIKPIKYNALTSGDGNNFPVNLSVMAFNDDPNTTNGITENKNNPHSFFTMSQFRFMFIKQTIKKTDGSDVNTELHGSSGTRFTNNDNSIQAKDFYDATSMSGNVLTIANPQWYSVKAVFDLDNDNVEYYFEGELVGTAKISDLGLTGIKAVGFGVGTQVKYSEQYIDNVEITYTAPAADPVGGVRAVRFLDYKGNMYGATTKATTTIDTVALSFWSTPDNASEATVKLYEGNSPVEYTPSTGVNGEYILNLKDLLVKDTSYKLEVTGLTVNNGTAVDDYTQTFKTDENGVFIIDKIAVTKTGTEGVYEAGDKITAETKIINTTGTEGNYMFTLASYEGDILSKVDFIDFTAGTKAGDAEVKKSAVATCEYTLTAEEAAKLTKASAFLWNGKSFAPESDRVDFNFVRTPAQP